MDQDSNLVPRSLAASFFAVALPWSIVAGDIDRVLIDTEVRIIHQELSRKIRESKKGLGACVAADRKSVTVFVRSKREAVAMRADSLTTLFGDLEMRAVVVGAFRVLQGNAANTQEESGVRLGRSISRSEGLATGTLGCRVRDASGVYLLSNSHVLKPHGSLARDSLVFSPAIARGTTRRF